MMREIAYNYVPKSPGKILRNISGASNQSIIDALHGAIKPATEQVRNLAEHFRGETPRETARNIHNFLRAEIQYKADGIQYQDIRLPSHFLATGSGDCKSYTLFTVAILNALGIPFIIRYASYNSDPTPSHVYTVLPDGTVIDGIYPGFDIEKKYIYKRDYLMNVRQIAGPADGPILGLKDTFKQFGNWVKDQANKIEQPFKTGALAPVRGAFLALLAINFRGWATIIAKAPKQLQDEVKLKWYNLGGNRTEFMNVVNNAKNKKPLFGQKQINGPVILGGHGIGAEPVSTATLAATAAPAIAIIVPVVTKIVQWLNDNGDNLSELGDAVKEYTGNWGGGDQVEQLPGGGGFNPGPGSGGPAPVETFPPGGSGSAPSMPNIPTWAIVAGLAGLFLVLKK